MNTAIFYIEKIDSTNSYVKRNFADLANGTLIFAGEQTAGRGRLGRHWHSPAGKNFYGTAVLKEVANGLEANIILSLAALATIKLFDQRLDCFIKWPNDIYVENRKLAGMLSEGILGAGNTLVGVAAGIGINLNMTAEELAQIDNPAASIFAESNREIDVAFFAKELAFALKQELAAYTRSAADQFARWRAANRLVGKQIEITLAGERLAGVFKDITPSGEMVFEAADGVKTINAADVHIIKESLFD